jgi:hypothetical protein
VVSRGFGGMRPAIMFRPPLSGQHGCCVAASHNATAASAIAVAAFAAYAIRTAAASATADAATEIIGDGATAAALAASVVVHRSSPLGVSCLATPRSGAATGELELAYLVSPVLRAGPRIKPLRSRGLITEEIGNRGSARSTPRSRG